MKTTLYTDTFFRAGVGIILYNKHSQKVLVGKRQKTDKRTHAVWQFPQGGIEHNHSIMETAKTELWEETGIKIKKKNLISTLPGFLTVYEIPGENKKYGRGQVHRWLIFSYEGPAELNDPQDDEFTELKWIEFSHLLNKKVSGIKAKIYREVYDEVKEHSIIVI